MTKKSLLSRKELNQLLEVLIEKYKENPEAIESFFPDLAQKLSFILPEHKSFVPSFGLTEKERYHRQESLKQIIKKVNEDSIITEEAIKGLEHSAVLIEDGNLPSEITYFQLVELLRKALGVSPGSVKKSLTIPVKTGEIAKNIPLVKGVMLNLTWENQLVSVSLDLRKVKERRAALRFVSIAENDAPDVAEKHDYYLAGAIKNA